MSPFGNRVGFWDTDEYTNVIDQTNQHNDNRAEPKETDTFCDNKADSIVRYYRAQGEAPSLLSLSQK